MTMIVRFRYGIYGPVKLIIMIVLCTTKRNFLFTFYTFLLCGNQGLCYQVKRYTTTQQQQ